MDIFLPSISFLFPLGSFHTLPLCYRLPFGCFLFYQYIVHKPIKWKIVCARLFLVFSPSYFAFWCMLNTLYMPACALFRALLIYFLCLKKKEKDCGRYPIRILYMCIYVSLRMF